MTTAFVGGGNMATALIGALVRRGAPAATFQVIEPLAEQRAKLAARFAGIATYEYPVAECVRDCELVVFAVRPQQMREAAQALAGHLASKPVVLSIAAGIRLGD